MADELEKQITETQSEKIRIIEVERSQERTTQTIQTPQPIPAVVPEQLPTAPVPAQQPAATAPVADAPAAPSETKLEALEKISRICNAETRKARAEKQNSPEQSQFVGTGFKNGISSGQIGENHYALQYEERNIRSLEVSLYTQDGKLKPIPSRKLSKNDRIAMKNYHNSNMQSATLKNLSSNNNAVKMADEQNSQDKTQTLEERTTEIFVATRTETKIDTYNTYVITKSGEKNGTKPYYLGQDGKPYDAETKQPVELPENMLKALTDAAKTAQVPAQETPKKVLKKLKGKNILRVQTPAPAEQTLEEHLLGEDIEIPEKPEVPAEKGFVPMEYKKGYVTGKLDGKEVRYFIGLARAIFRVDGKALYAEDVGGMKVWEQMHKDYDASYSQHMREKLLETSHFGGKA
ncbi:MAG: hypothetical protein V1839_02950 [archaeon]